MVSSTLDGGLTSSSRQISAQHERAVESHWRRTSHGGWTVVTGTSDKHFFEEWDERRVLDIARSEGTLKPLSWDLLFASELYIEVGAVSE